MSMLNRLNNIESDYSLDEIIMALHTFKEAHVAEYELAVKKYNEERLTRAQNVLGKLASNQEVFVDYNFGLQKPENRAADYDRMINIFRQANKAKPTEEQYTKFGLDIKNAGTIKLDFDQADAIFNDKWDWLVNAKSINSFYAGSAK